MRDYECALTAFMLIVNEMGLKRFPLEIFNSRLKYKTSSLKIRF